MANSTATQQTEQDANPTQARQCTLLELVTQLSGELESEEDVVEQARSGLLDGSIQLTGNFRGREASFAA
jgi:hypothetical protein